MLLLSSIALASQTLILPGVELAPSMTMPWGTVDGTDAGRICSTPHAFVGVVEAVDTHVRTLTSNGRPNGTRRYPFVRMRLQQRVWGETVETVHVVDLSRSEWTVGQVVMLGYSRSMSRDSGFPFDTALERFRVSLADLEIGPDETRDAVARVCGNFAGPALRTP